MIDAQQHIKIWLQCRWCFQWYFTGKTDYRNSFLFCRFSHTIRSFAMQGLQVNASFTCDNEVNFVQCVFKMSKQKKLFNAVDQFSIQQS